jgi:hypothetical protein
VSDLRCVDPCCDDGPREEDGESRPRWATEGSLCARCYGAVANRLGDLPGQAAMLRDDLGGTGNKRTSENKPTKGNPPLPLNPDIHDHLELMHATVVSWVLLVRDERNLTGPDRNHLDALAPWLLGWLPWMATQSWVGDLCEEIRDLARQADRLTGHKPRWNRLEAPCPECHAHELGRWDGADEVACGSCGRAWPESDYPWLVRLLADERTVTAAQAAERLGVPAATFRKWVSRGLIERSGTVDGQHRYEVSAVDALVEREAS